MSRLEVVSKALLKRVERDLSDTSVKGYIATVLYGAVGIFLEEFDNTPDAGIENALLDRGTIEESIRAVLEDLFLNLEYDREVYYVGRIKEDIFDV